jgi:hypothetical protein
MTSNARVEMPRIYDKAAIPWAQQGLKRIVRG